MPDLLKRGAMRRRLRVLRRRREAMLLDLGALVLEMHRHGRFLPDGLQRRAAETVGTDAELRTMSRALGEGDGTPDLVAAGVAGNCERCGALHTLGAAFCSQCGAELPSGGRLPRKALLGRDPDLAAAGAGPLPRRPVAPVPATRPAAGLAAAAGPAASAAAPSTDADAEPSAVPAEAPAASGNGAPPDGAADETALLDQPTEETAAVEREETKPVERGEAAPGEREETAPAEPGEAAPGEPEETAPAEPENADPVEPVDQPTEEVAPVDREQDPAPIPPLGARRARATRVRQRLDEPARSSRALPAGLLAGIAGGILVIALGILVLSGGGDDGDGGADRAAQPAQREPEPPPPDEVQTPAESPADDAATVAGALEPVEGVTATDYDPSGDDQEHSEETRLAVDGDPATAWPTEEYETGELQKDGVGLTLSPVEPLPARGLDLETTTPGFEVTIYGAETEVPESVVSGWTEIASEEVSERKGRIQLDAAGRDFAHYLIWITALPADGGKVEIGEAQLLR